MIEAALSFSPLIWTPLATNVVSVGSSFEFVVQKAQPSKSSVLACRNPRRKHGSKRSDLRQFQGAEVV